MLIFIITKIECTSLLLTDAGLLSQQRDGYYQKRKLPYQVSTFKNKLNIFFVRKNMFCV